MALTTSNVDHGSHVGALLDQVTRPVTSFTADGAFDRDDVYSQIAEHHPGRCDHRAAAFESDIE